MCTFPNANAMTRKFLFCFPLRVGNIVFGYTIVIICIAAIAFNLYELIENIKPEDEFEHDEKFGNWENLEEIFGHRKNALVAIITLVYYASYIVIAFLLLVFTIMFICGASKANYCLVTTFFVYCFLHLFLTISLIVFEATSKGYYQLGIILLSDLLLIICLFSVKYLMEAIKTGKMYTHPYEDSYKYAY